MEIRQRSDDFFIEGNIKTIGDFQAIKHALDAFIKHNTSVKLTIKDSISLIDELLLIFLLASIMSFLWAFFTLSVPVGDIAHPVTILYFLAPEK